MSKYPDGNPKTVLGQAKPSLHAIPPNALLQLGAVMANGEAKYGLFNWRAEPISALVYYDALMRHLLEWRDGTDIDSESGKAHLAHVMANCAILLDAMSCGTLNDNRMVKGEVKKSQENLTATVQEDAKNLAVHGYSDPYRSEYDPY